MAVLVRGVSALSFTQTTAIRRSLIERDEFVPWNAVGEKTFVEWGDRGTVDYMYPNGTVAASFSYVDSDELADQSLSSTWRWIATYAALATLNFLRDISWIDGGTRFVAVDFNMYTYNPSTGLHSSARIAWEMPTGGVHPNAEIKT